MGNREITTEEKNLFQEYLRSELCKYISFHEYEKLDKQGMLDRAKVNEEIKDE